MRPMPDAPLSRLDAEQLLDTKWKKLSILAPGGPNFRVATPAEILDLLAMPLGSALDQGSQAGTALALDVLVESDDARSR